MGRWRRCWWSPGWDCLYARYGSCRVEAGVQSWVAWTYFSCNARILIDLLLLYIHLYTCVYSCLTSHAVLAFRFFLYSCILVFLNTHVILPYTCCQSVISLTSNIAKVAINYFSVCSVIFVANVWLIKSQYLPSLYNVFYTLDYIVSVLTVIVLALSWVEAFCPSAVLRIVVNKPDTFITIQ